MMKLHHWIAAGTALLGLASLGQGCGDGSVPYVDRQQPPVVDPVDPLPGEGERELSDRGPRPGSPFAPSPARLRRLLAIQYSNAVQDLLGTAAREVANPPADVPLNGFISVGAGDLSLSASVVDSYEAGAAAAAAAAVADPNSPLHAVCTPAGADDAACFSQIATVLGRRAFRRTLEADEVTRFSDLALEAATAYGEANKGLEFLTMALLQSPHFLYIVEVGDAGGDDEARLLTGTELATRLSFFITASPPSDELLTAAENGSLSSPAALEAEARALLTEPRARDALRAYFGEKLQFALLETLNRPDPALTNTVRQEMVEETLRTIDDIVWDRDADARELLTTPDTFVNDDLAAYYGFELPGSGSFFTKVTTPAVEGRAGIFSQGAFLVRFAHPDRSSPTLRGKFLREQLLCSAVPAPPNDVVTTLPESTNNDLPQTTRDRMIAHQTEPRCAACHSSMDPLGFPLENFDQFGRYRTHENGLPIDASGDLDGDAAVGAAGFMGVLERRSDMVSCLVRGLFRHGTGHLEEIGEDPSLYDVDTAFISSGMRLQEGLVAIVSSDAFRFVNTLDEVQP
ncbi:MAG: DUF1588 domain-containing protein [Deltaproteobacteria bacterium]|nr:DUF1588 domain-containing protein [Deltaproteobacteria bacterium]